jgi:hypothetical protein
MKIYDTSLTGTSAAELGRTQQTQSTGKAGSSSSTTQAGAGDRVEFSGSMGQLTRALSAFESSQGSRLQALTSDYQSGRYQSSSLATSKSMITEALSAGLQ